MPKRRAQMRKQRGGESRYDQCKNRCDPVNNPSFDNCFEKFGCTKIQKEEEEEAAKKKAEEEEEREKKEEEEEEEALKTPAPKLGSATSAAFNKPLGVGGKRRSRKAKKTKKRRARKSRKTRKSRR